MDRAVKILFGDLLEDFTFNDYILTVTADPGDHAEDTPSETVPI